ncbi:hypothetical protein BGZ99_008730 [Dissophora globulifera]|uniref:Ion transport domain-containing protein n=1 Tax=Dissophora globulifera TaxID=979702 RepID=A0A9P6R7I3_9FUNG|nr:hypothetical protein BGZ99_008730 [Dissophora globulifera]
MKVKNDINARPGDSNRGLLSGFASRLRRQSSQASPPLPFPVSTGVAYPGVGDSSATKDLPAQSLILLCPPPAAEASHNRPSETEAPALNFPVRQGSSVVATDNFPSRLSGTADTPHSRPQGVEGVIDPDVKSNSGNNNEFILDMNDHNGCDDPTLAPSDGTLVSAKQLARVTTAVATRDTEATPALLTSFLPAPSIVQETTTVSPGLKANSGSMTLTAPTLTLSPPTVPLVFSDLQESSDNRSIPPLSESSIPSVALDPTLTAPPESAPRLVGPVLLLDVPFHPPPAGPCKPEKIYDDISRPSTPLPTDNGEGSKPTGQNSEKREQIRPEVWKKNLFQRRKAKGDLQSAPEADDDKSQAKMPQDQLKAPPTTGGNSGIQTSMANGNDDQSKPVIPPSTRGFKWRWHLQQGTGPIPSALTPSEWTAMLEIDNITNGWYSIVICISFENEGNNPGELFSAEFDVRYFDASKQPVYAEKTCRTVAGQEELSYINSGEEKRIRLHRQIELSQGGFIEVTAMLKGLSVSVARVHYVELQQGNKSSDDEQSDLVLYGEGKPDEVILLGVSPDVAAREHHTVHAHDISATGTHAATLRFNSSDEAVIEVWYIHRSTTIAPSTSATNVDRNSSQQVPLQYTSPLARDVISIPDVNHIDRADICLRISADGSHVAIHSNEPSLNVIPCHIFMVNSNNNKGSSTINDMNGHQAKSSRSTLTSMSLPRTLRGFSGYGTFHLVDMAATDDLLPNVFWQENPDWYITSDGTSLSVYKITSKCVLVRKMTFGAEPHLGAALDAISSLRGRYFAWTGIENVLSIWDLASGQQVSYFQVEGGSAGTRARLSRDGSLVAVSVKGAITVHETATGVKLGSYSPGLGDNNYFEIVLERYHAMVLDQLLPKDAKDKIVERKIVAVSDMSVVRRLPVHRDYAVRSPVPANYQILSYSQVIIRNGSVVNIIRMDTKLISAPALDRLDDDIMTPAKIDQLSRAPQSYTSAAKNIFDVTSSTSIIYGTKMTLITITYSGDASQAYNGPEAALAIPLGSSHILYPAVFMKPTSRLAIVTGHYLQIWKLHEPSPADSKDGRRRGEIAELELLWALHREDKVKPQDIDISQWQISNALVDMELGEQVLFELQPASRFSRSEKMPEEPVNKVTKVVTVPISSKDTLHITLQDRIQQGIRGVVDMYVNGDKVCRRATIRYLRTLMRPSDDNPVSCIVTLCQFWKREQREAFEQMMADLLPTKDITWVPITNLKEEDKDPLAILFQTAETQSAVIGVAKVIIDYCVSHANSSSNLAFLAPIFKSMHGVMKFFPEEASLCLSKIAYIPAKNRSYIIDNHIIARPPRWRFQFWKSEETVLLCDTPDPIMQFQVTPSKQDALNDRFTLPVFVASFDALWFYNDDEREAENRSRLTEINDGMRRAVATTSMTKKISRWTTFMHMLKLKLRLKNKTYVECYDFNLEIFENPAIAALVTYKWNTMGFSYWLGRFMFQFFYYTLVIVAAILQVYLPHPTVLLGVFVTIIVMAAVFTWLEILQAIRGWNKYKRSPYNFLDLVAFLVPMAAAIDQIVVIVQNDPQGNVRILSFSVLIVSFHMLFELRINKSVCKYVTIIQQAVTEMQVFFIIFAAGIFAFTIGMLHLLHACPTGGCISANTGFPTHFLGALSSTYFFMGGRYDPVSDVFDSQDWAFHLMMVIYFFFTVILILNVLIALVNVAFTKGDDSWRLTWVESRLRYIESAENMSYHIPGYRASYDCFPKEIYFSATEQRVKAYQERYRKKDDNDSHTEKDKAILAVRGEMKSLQEQSQRQFEELKGQSERQLQELKERSEIQLQELKELLHRR